MNKLAIIIALIPFLSFGQTESFDTGAFPPITPFNITNPIDVSSGGLAFSGDLKWYRSDDPQVNGTFPNSGMDLGYDGTGNCVVMNSYEWCCGYQVEMVLNNVDLTSFLAPSLSFYIYHPDGTEELDVSVRQGIQPFTSVGYIATNYGAWTKLSFDLTGFSAQNVDVKFTGYEGSGSAGSYNLAIDEIVIQEQVNMAYVSSNTTQESCSFYQGGNDQSVIGVEVEMNGTLNPFDVTNLSFSTNGTTDVNDILNASVYYTGTTGVFSNENLVGSVAAPSGAFAVNGSVTLSDGVNYFWLVYDVAMDASVGNLFDAECIDITVNSTVETPTVTAPAGTVPLNNNAVFFVTNLNNGGAGSLRAAVAGAEAYGCDAIVDARNVSGTISLTSYISVFSSNDITVLGSGADNLIVSGSLNGGNAFYHNGDGKLTINGFEFTEHGSEAIYSPNSFTVVEYCYFNSNIGDGAIYVPSGKLIVKNSTFFNNQNTGSFAGAIYTPSADVTLLNCTFDSNWAFQGGGAIYHPSGVLTIDQCTFTGNHANNNSSTYNGGAIINYGTMNVTNSIFDGNTCQGSSSALNISGSVNMNYSFMHNSTGTTISGGNNIIGGTSGLLGLGMNGGHVPTNAIPSGSFAENSGDGISTLSKDQRDYCRTGVNDMGAYEIDGQFTDVITTTLTVAIPNDTICSNEEITFTATVSNAGTSPMYYWVMNGNVVASSTSSIYATSEISSGDIFSCIVGTFIDDCEGVEILSYSNLIELDLTIFDIPTYTSVITDVTCFGGNDGVVDVTAVGGSPFSFQWNSGQTTEDLIGVSSGQYDLTAVDTNGCSSILSLVIAEPSPMDLDITGVDATCGQFDGSAVVSVLAGGTSPFNYTWTNGSNAATADSLASGTYTVQVMDADGCNSSISISLSDSDGPTIASSAITDASCVGDNDGEVDVTISGGTTPYTFDWSNGSSSEDLTGLMAGSYDFLVTDANGCEASATYTVSNPNPIDLSNVTVTESTCAGSDGEATVIPSGGTGNYTYQWGAGAGSVTTATASGLGAGVYNIFVSDDNGCVSSGLVTVNNIGAPSIIENVIIQPSCTGVQSGSIDVSVSGGVTPYVYSWSNGASTEDLTGLSPDTLELTVTDAIGCVGTYVGIVNGLTPLTESICMVTVDTLTATNLIIWEKTDTVGISHYNIYREGNSTGSYNLVGTNPVNQLSQWVDPTADPQLRSWRYKISAVDSCGNESQLSASHKTMHVTANLGLGGTINCSWDFYDGFTYGSYYISRYHGTTGWEELDTMPSSLTSWTDATPPGQTGLQYSVSIVPPSSCTSTKAQDHNTTRSNRATITGPGSDVSIVENGISLFTVYPNPSNGKFTINLDTAPTQQWSYRVLDLRGKLITSQAETGTTSLVNISNLESGIYLVEVTVNGTTRNVKVVLQ